MEAKNVKGVFLSKNNFREMMGHFVNDAVIEITCNTYSYAVCSTEILVCILEKEMIKYELKFSQLSVDTCYVINHNEQSWILSNRKFSKELCECSQVTNGVYGMFLIAKSMNFLNSKTIWPIIISHSFYVDQDFTFDMCDWCKGMKQDLLLFSKLFSNKADIGVYVEEKSTLPFLNQSNLLTSIKNNVKIVCERKLFSNNYGSDENVKNSRQKRSKDKRIHEFLAKEGISIATANELHINLDQDQKEKIENIFGIDYYPIFKHKHSFEIQGIEHFFLMSFFLHMGKPLESFLSLSKKKYYKSTKYLQMVDYTMQLFRELAKNIKKVDNLILFFSKNLKSYYIQETEVLDRNMLNMLGTILRIYLKSKYENTFETAIVLETKDEMMFYSSDVSFGNVNPELIIEKDEHIMKVSNENFKAVLKQLVLLDEEIY